MVLRIEIAGTGEESLCVRARKLIAGGVDPSEVVEWLRDGQPIWARNSRLSVWAAHSVIESNGGGYPSFVKYRPKDEKGQQPDELAAYRMALEDHPDPDDDG